MTSGPGNNAMAAAVQGPNAMAGNHGNAAFLRDPMAALKQQQFMQRQLLAEQVRLTCSSQAGRQGAPLTVCSLEGSEVIWWNDALPPNDQKNKINEERKI